MAKTKQKPENRLNGALSQAVAAITPPPLRIDLGCGANKKEGFLGVDSYQFPGVDLVHDVTKPWPWEDDSVDEVYCAHLLEHLTNFDNRWERVHFFNELYRVLKPTKLEGGKPVEGFCTLVIPHWCSNRFYGDPTHKEPFSEMGFYYLKREWRLGNGKEIPPNAPHTDESNFAHGYSCDFDVVWGNGVHPHWMTRNPETAQNALTWYKEAILDLHATLTCRK